MFLPMVLLLAGSVWSIHGQNADFTINSVYLRALPSPELDRGQTLQLNCSVKFAWSTEFELNSTISFYKNDNLIYNVTTSKKHEIYTIRNATVSKSGVYKCHVSVGGREKKSNELKVKVSKLSPPSITISKNEVKEGDEVIVRCAALEEEPPMVFFFYKHKWDKQDGKEISKDEKKKDLKAYENFAEVSFEIKEGENYLQFSCSVNLILPGETSPPSTILPVTALAPFTTPKIEVFPSLNFTEGNDMSVKCSIQKQYLRPEKVTITLQKDSHIVNSSTTEALTYIQFATMKDMGNYTCKAEGTRVSKSSSVMITVTELFPRPRLMVHMYASNRYINEGDRLYLECSVSDLSPEVFKRVDHYFIIHKEIKRFVKHGEKFHLTAKESDSGEYLCELTISNVTKTSEPVVLQVYAPVTKPVLKHINKDNRMVVPGDTLELTCKSQSGTPPITYSLHRGNEHLDTKTVLDRSEARFLVNVTKPKDSGQYWCHATNKNEKTREQSNIENITVIIPVQDVSLTIIPSSGEVEEGSELTLVCSVKNGTLPINFQFYVMRGSEILLYNETKKDQAHTSFEVPSFSKNGDGAYFCVASNRASKGTRSRSISAKAILATWKKGVIGAFVIIILVAAVAIGLYLYMDKKKKGKDISIDNRTAKDVSSSNEKTAVEMKTGNLYVGSIQNEDELHILKTAEENIGNNEQNHDGEYTQVDDANPDTHEDSVETNINRIDSAPDSNNHT